MELLRTDTVLIRSWSEEDLEVFFDLYSRSEVAQWLGRHPRRALTTREEAQQRLDAWRQRNDALEPPQGLWAVVALGADPSSTHPVGTVLLLPLEGPGTEFEIGWHLHPTAQGHGCATQAAQGIIDAAQVAGITQLLALTDLDNIASAAVARRLGMHDQGETTRWFNLTTRQFSLSL